jgi:hypothetical protein
VKKWKSEKVKKFAFCLAKLAVIDQAELLGTRRFFTFSLFHFLG